jgi:hypothetical protein
VPVDGTYMTVDKDENQLGRILRGRCGDHFPNCLPGETGYILIETASHPR